MKLLFRMTPKGSFYSGSQYLDSYDFPFPRSDSLFRAIVKSWETLWGAGSVQTLLAKYWHGQTDKDIPFYVSSILPVVANSYFLPRPATFEFATHENERSNTPEQIAWISADTYHDWLKGNKIIWNSDHFLLPGLYFHQKEVALLKTVVKDKIAWCEDEGRTRNVSDLFNADCKPYPANQIFYAEKLDWYVLCELHAEYQAKLEAVFRFLADEGIGGKRGIGCGSYLYHAPVALPEVLDFAAAPLTGHFMTLSLYYPSLAHVQHGMLKQARLNLVERQGWCLDVQGHAVRQEKVRLVREGSCLPCSTVPTPGLIQVGSSKANYHYVYPFGITASAI
jgi:CRISPR type III-A-associated RAMP protein Csm4